MPGPLTNAAVAEVVGDRLGEEVDSAFADACHSSTDGNPLLLNELLKTLAADRVQPDAAHAHVVAELGPRAASRAVMFRLARLSPDALQAARAISVLGDGAEFTVAAALAQLDALPFAAATRDLVHAEILRPDPPLGFVHELVRAAVYHDLAPAERELYHEQAAKLLAGLDAPKEQIAAHVLAMPARGQDWVVAVLRDAADAAFARGDLDAAISLLRRALGEPPRPELRPELLLELGRVEARTFLPDATDHLQQAYELARDPFMRGDAADQLGRTLIFLGAPDRGGAIAGEAARELPTEFDDFARRLEAVEFFALSFGAEPNADERERMLAYRDMDASGGLGVKGLAAVVAWHWTLSGGPAERVCALARKALEGGSLLAGDGLMVLVATVPLALADLDEAVDGWDVQRAEAHRQGSVFRIGGVQLWNGYTQHLRGDLAEAESELRASQETVALWGMPIEAQWAPALLAEVLVERGAIGEGHALLDAAGSPHAGSDHAILVDRARMRILLAEGRAEEALEYADVFELRAGWMRQPRYAPWRSLKAQALDRLGRQDEAVELAVDELEIARGWGSAGTVGRSLRVLGTILRTDGIEQLEEACALLEKAPARLEHAKALAALGGMLRRARKPTEARGRILQQSARLLELLNAIRAQDRSQTHASERPTAAGGSPCSFELVDRQLHRLVLPAEPVECLCLERPPGRIAPLMACSSASSALTSKMRIRARSTRGSHSARASCESGSIPKGHGPRRIAPRLDQSLGEERRRPLRLDWHSPERARLLGRAQLGLGRARGPRRCACGAGPRARAPADRRRPSPWP